MGEPASVLGAGEGDLTSKRHTVRVPLPSASFIECSVSGVSEGQDARWGTWMKWIQGLGPYFNCQEPGTLDPVQASPRDMMC